MQEDEQLTLTDHLVNLVNTSQFAHFVYFGVISISGVLFLSFLIIDGYQLIQDTLYMVGWLVLFILFPPPTKALLKSAPFEDQGIITD